MDCEKDILDFFKDIVLDNSGKRNNLKDIIDGLQDIKNFLIKNYLRSENRWVFENIYDDINNFILGLPKIDVREVMKIKQEIIIKILNLEHEIIKFISYFKSNEML